ncbi:lycopene cyclase domain-containing protein [Nocardia sp. NPDC049220]|uniref:lycopene cyclase domain-containing protein n=1 Tax=Nocardia sp. NPDC049220 TaxID=3155273 RepID=UPI0033CFE849
MTYLQFLAIFLLPPLIGVLAVTRYTLRQPDRPRRPYDVGLRILALLLLVAWVWTTPWDSWIIRVGVWTYPEGGVVATLARVPLEEYLFMAGQTCLAGLWTLWQTSRVDALEPAVSNGTLRRIAGAVAWSVAAMVGAFVAVTNSHGLYLGSMLMWFGPLLAVQCAVGADLLRMRRAVRLRTLVPVVAYLWVADRIAIAAGTWHISADYTSGISILGLPLEEALFFAVTSLLIVNSLVLATHPALPARLRTFVPKKIVRQ